mgnify:CR=1 FL=1
MSDLSFTFDGREIAGYEGEEVDATEVEAEAITEAVEAEAAAEAAEAVADDVDWGIVTGIGID